TCAESPPWPCQRRAYPPQFGHHIRLCTKQSSEFQADRAARRYRSVDLQDLQSTPQMPPSHPPPASLNTARVESILLHAAIRSQNVKNIPNAIPLPSRGAIVDTRSASADCVGLWSIRVRNGTPAGMHDFIQALMDAIALVGSGDPELVQIVALSLRVSLSAS